MVLKDECGQMKEPSVGEKKEQSLSPTALFPWMTEAREYHNVGPV